MWIDANKPPEEGGYYLTYYRNTEKPEVRFFYKAFWYSTDEKKWLFRFDPDVICYWDVRYDFYVPCQLQDNVDPVPEKWVPKPD